MSLDERDYMRERSIYGGKRTAATWGKADTDKKKKLHITSFALGFLGVVSLIGLIWIIVGALFFNRKNSAEVG
jgi:hypothetical protein